MCLNCKFGVQSMLTHSPIGLSFIHYTTGITPSYSESCLICTLQKPNKEHKSICSFVYISSGELFS